jgi:hypothetical protein
VTPRRGLLRAAIGGVAVGALGYLMRSMVKAVTREGVAAAAYADRRRRCLVRRQG